MKATALIHGFLKPGENDKYRYPPLNKSKLQIRLLTLDPAPSWSADLHCHLQVVDLRPSMTKFEALSYTWDGGVETEPLMLDGVRRLVTPNLESFLRHRRETGEPVVLWVDAVCINQKKKGEKCSQVKMMNMIYAAASRLTIWLGKAEDDSELAMDTVWDLGTRSPFEKMPVLAPNVLTALKKLFNRNWWFRIWIVQEVYWGGAGRKLSDIRVRCGFAEHQWTTFVVAAARMQAHQEDQRQQYPGISNILNLESIRYQPREVLKRVANEKEVFELVAEHRKFQATNPRDKIFAVLGMVFGENQRPCGEVTVSYKASTRKIYKDFALLGFRGVGIDVLRQCHGREIITLPTWVPDWTVCSTTTPLPSNKLVRSKMEPWWMNPIIEDTLEENHKPRLSFKASDVSTGATLPRSVPQVLINTIPKEFSDLLSETDLQALQALIDEKKLIWVSQQDDSGHLMKKKTTTNGWVSEEDAMEHGLHLIQKGERVTQARAEANVVASTIPSRGYRASGNTKSIMEIQKASDTLIVEGILWDTVELLQETFADDLEKSWENSTRFMVAIGQAKQLALGAYTGPNPYLTTKARTEAFWLTLLANQTTLIDEFGRMTDIKAKMPFQDWLPEVPKDWKLRDPPVTVVSCGRLESAQYTSVMFPEPEDYTKFGLKDGERLEVEMPGINMSENLQPLEWTEEDRQSYSTAFKEVSELWQTQPLDLYHRPFSLPTVVPDPFWDDRKLDEKSKVKNINTNIVLRKLQFFGLDVLNEIQRKYCEEKVGDMVPMVPINTLEPGFEKYALGRRLIITRKGYIGLAPRETVKGDRVAVFFGSEVPFILRATHLGGFEIVGETYVHGIMEGEVVREYEKCKVGKCNIALH